MIFSAEKRTRRWHDAARAAGFRSNASIPLRRRGAITAVLTVYAATTHYFDSEFISLLEEMGRDVSFSLDVLAGEQERKRAQQELEYKTTMLLTQQESAPDAILVIDENARIVSHNQQFIDLWAIPVDMVRAGLDEPVLQSVLGQIQDPDIFLNKVNYLYEHKAERSHDEIRLKDGRIIDRHSAPVIGADGKYFGRVWYFRDISERRRSERALAESEARFRQMADTMGQVFWMASPDGSSMIYVSPAFEKIWGWTCPELYADPLLWMKAIHPEDAPNVVASLERLAQGNAYDIEFRITRRDGVVRWINDRGYVNCDDAGRVVLTTGISTDVTDRKRSEVELRESERRFSDMLGNVQLVSLMLDRNARITYCNDYLLQLTGWQREEVVGRDWFEVFIPPDHGDLKSVFADLIANSAASMAPRKRNPHPVRRAPVDPLEQYAPALGLGRGDRRGKHRRGRNRKQEGRGSQRPAGGDRRVLERRHRQPWTRSHHPQLEPRRRAPVRMESGRSDRSQRCPPGSTGAGG